MLAKGSAADGPAFKTADGVLYLCGKRGAFATGEVLGIGSGMHASTGKDFIDLATGMYGEQAIEACLEPQA